MVFGRCWLIVSNFAASSGTFPRPKDPEGDSKSSAHPQASLAKQGNPLASASLTTNPQVSP